MRAVDPGNPVIDLSMTGLKMVNYLKYPEKTDFLFVNPFSSGISWKTLPEKDTKEIILRVGTDEEVEIEKSRLTNLEL